MTTPQPKTPAIPPTSEDYARSIIDELYTEMGSRGVVTTMVYDFGIPIVASALAAKDAELASLRAELGTVYDKLHQSEAAFGNLSLEMSELRDRTRRRDPEEFVAYLKTLTPFQRLDQFSVGRDVFCDECGDEHPTGMRCQCNNDD